MVLHVRQHLPTHTDLAPHATRLYHNDVAPLPHAHQISAVYHNHSIRLGQFLVNYAKFSVVIIQRPTGLIHCITVVGDDVDVETLISLPEKIDVRSAVTQP